MARPDTTEAVTRGATRHLTEMGFAVLPEMILANGRRADLMGLGPKGEVVIAEVKSCQADFDVDTKWPDYLDYCDQFYFAVSEDFPIGLLPPDVGLMVADGFGAGIIRPAPVQKLAAARRKALTLRFARQAASRLTPTEWR